MQADQGPWVLIHCDPIIYNVRVSVYSCFAFPNSYLILILSYARL